MSARDEFAQFESWNETKPVDAGPCPVCGALWSVQRNGASLAHRQLNCGGELRKLAEAEAAEAHRAFMRRPIKTNWTR